MSRNARDDGTPDPGGEALRRGYFGNVLAAARTTAEGLAVTLAQYFRRPTTVQYPDRTALPVVDTLPERYRGFLEVDLDICTACKACERDCPINVIAIDIEKVDDTRVMTRFDIDMGKCMYCGICVESCPVPGQAPCDREVTKSIRMTREFEAATAQFPSLTFRFIRPGDYVIPFKPKKGVLDATRRRGEIAREVRKRSAEYNAVAFQWSLRAQARAAAQAPRATGEPAAELVRDEVLSARAAELAPQVAAAGHDARKLETLLYEQALGQTDCEACGWPTCRAFADALVSGRDHETWKCRPGGARSTRDTNLILQLRAGKSPGEAARVAREVTLAHHREPSGT